MSTPRLNHPAAATLEAFARGGLSDADRQSVAEHLADCAVCRTIAAETAELPAATMAASAEPGPAGGDRPERTLALPQPPAIEDGTVMVAVGDTDRTILTGGDSPAATVRPGQSRGDIDGLSPDLANHPRYHVLRQLGQGGMGSVYEAQHLMMERTVALKVIRGAFTANAAAVARFRQEVRTAARLSHPNIVSAFDAEQAGDTHFLIMEYVPGSSLGEYLREKGRLPVAEACRYAEQAAHGLQHAFEKGMVHRDIKPDNLMRTQDGQIKILDFGLARLGAAAANLGEATMADSPTPSSQTTSQLTSAGVVMGTPDYIAPEQGTDSHSADIRADIYSLGCTLYLMLSGRVPFPGGDPLDKIVRHAREAPTPLQQLRPELPRGLIAIVEKMLAKSPAGRYQSPHEVAAALKPFAHPAPPIRRPVLIAVGAAAAAIRRPLQIAVGLVAAALILLIVVLSALPDRDLAVSARGRGASPKDDKKDHESEFVEPAPQAAAADTPKPANLREMPVPDSKELAARPAPADSLDPERVPAAHRERLRMMAPGDLPFPLVAVLGARGFQGHSQGRWPAFSPDGTQVAVAARGEAVIYDARTGARLRSLAAPDGDVNRLAWHSKGQWVAGGCRDGFVCLWTADGTKRVLLKETIDEVTSLAVSRDDEIIAAGQRSGPIQLWNTRTQQHLGTLRGHTKSVTGLAFTYHAETLYSASQGQLRAHDPSSRWSKGEWPLQTQGFVSLVHSPVAEMLAVGDDRRMRALNSAEGASAGTEIWSQDARAGWLAFDPGGRSLLSAQVFPVGNRDVRLRRSNAATGEALREDLIAQLSADDPMHYALSPDGQTLAVQEYSNGAKALMLFDAQTGKPIDTGDGGHSDGVIQVAFSTDGRWLASCSHDQTVRVWDLSTGRQVHVLRGHTGFIRSVAFSSKGLLASAGWDRTARLWDPVQGLEVGRLEHPHSIEQIAFSPDGRRLACACWDRCDHVWDVASRKLEMAVPGHEFRGNALDFDRTGEWLISGGVGGEIILHDTRTWKETAVMPVHGLGTEKDVVHTIVSLPDNSGTVSTGADGSVSLWGFRDKRSKRLATSKLSMNSAAVRADGKLLAAVSFDGTLRLVDLESPDLRSGAWKLFPENSWLHSVAFSPEGRYLATANPDGTIYVFRLASKGEVATVPVSQ